MREINSAFENLRRAVPVAVAGPSGASSPVSSPQCASSAASSEKLTKITTLRLAMKYIRILSDMLHGGGGGGGGENNNDRDTVNHNEIEREVMQKGLLLMEGGYLSSPAVSPVRAPAEPVKPASTKSSSSSGNTTSGSSPRKRTQTKRTSSSRAKKSTNSSNSSSSSSSTSSSTRSTARTRALASSLAAEKIPESQLQLQTAPSLLVDPTRPDPLGMDVDLGSVLESDNDSLILSEPCLSPLTAGSVTGGLKSHGFGCPGSQSVVPNDSLEFGLFLESDADSLQLSEPCLSPLGHLDSLNPFNELLHTGFNEQTALELYL